MTKVKKCTLIGLGCWLFITTSVCPLTLDDNDELFNKTGTTQMGRSTQCIPQAELSKNLIALRSNLSGDDLFNAKSLLLSNAKKSSECRSQVVRSLVTAMEQPGTSNGLGGVDSETYALWRNGAELLGELQATEALDLMIANFGVTDGLSISLGHYPALGAVVRIGEPAIPKLEEVVHKNSNAYMRKLAVFCIASIGGAKAKTALSKALQVEADSCVKKFINVSLEVFDNKVNPNHITAEANGRWYSHVYCSQGP